MSSHRWKAIQFWAYPAALLAVWLAVSAFTLTQLTTVIPSLTAPSCTVQPAAKQMERAVARGRLDRC
jgi:hypothetical protein